MLLDLQRDALRADFVADVCIVGGGIAGLLLADALARANFRVDLLEAGGLRPEPRSESVFAIEYHGQRHSGATCGRCRVLGGGSSRWGGQLLPFPPETFRGRDADPMTSWPFSASDVYRFGPRILDIMKAGHLSFGADLPTQLDKPDRRLAMDGLRVRYSKWAPFSHRNLAQTIGLPLAQRPNVRIILHANVVSIELHRRGSHVTHVLCRSRMCAAAA